MARVGVERCFPGMFRVFCAAVLFPRRHERSALAPDASSRRKIRHAERLRFGVRAALVVALVGSSVFGTGEVMADKKAVKQKDIVYIEASTANRWKLGEFGKRMNDDRYRIETMTLYEFDKTPRVNKALNERASRPDMVIVQECSVYFPGDLQDYQLKYQSWIRQIRQSGATPVIATTVPPAASQGFVEDAKAWVKVTLLGRPSQYDQVVQFNEWLRQLARDEYVPLFDLERHTRKSDTDRHMRDEFNAGDGIHLNVTAYAMLDRELHGFLNSLK